MYLTCYSYMALYYTMWPNSGKKSNIGQSKLKYSKTHDFYNCYWLKILPTLILRFNFRNITSIYAKHFIDIFHRYLCTRYIWVVKDSWASSKKILVIFWSSASCVSIVWSRKKIILASSDSTCGPIYYILKYMWASCTLLLFWKFSSE